MGATTVSTDYHTANGTGPLHAMGAGAVAGHERVMVIPYTTTAIESGSTINIAYLPKGAILTGLTAECEANAADTTLKLVHGTTDISAATAISTAGGDVVTANLQALDGAAITAATLLTAVTGGATLAADKAIVFTVKYVLD